MRITIKLGGSILEEAGIRQKLLEQISHMAARGYEIILVHGGGKSLNRRLSQMQMTSRFIEGLRVTDAETLEVAVMVLAGEVNKKIVAEMSRLGTRALGFAGRMRVLSAAHASRSFREIRRGSGLWGSRLR